MNNTTINNKQQNSKNNFFQCLNSTIKSEQSQNQSKFSSLTLNNSMASRKRNYYYGGNGNPSTNPNDEKFNSNTAAITTATNVLIENSKKSKLYNEDKKQFSYLPLPIPSKNNSLATTSSSFSSHYISSSLVKNGCSSKNITNISLNTSNFNQKNFSTIKNSEIKSTIDQNKNNKNNINNSRNMRLITGDIKFILNIHKNYKESIDALYEVYAKLIKIIKGNHSSEHYLFLRNHTGPVLKGIYYEIDRKLPIIEIDQNVCCVGRFNTQNQFQIFKIQSIPFQSPPDDYITRMHNICGFSINKNHQT